MKILGYSERGLVNALLYDIQHSPDAVPLLEILLSHAHFPFVAAPGISIRDAEVLIEQSFSDFGDADAVLLITNETHRISIFVEAKVKPSHTPRWLISDEYSKFVVGTRTKLDSSNLFTQLYHKQHMVSSLRMGGIQALQTGVRFPDSSSKPIRKIGNNPVVLRAASKVQEYLGATYYLALIPDTPTNVARFFQERLQQATFPDLPYWNVGSYGYLTWSEIAGFCSEHKMEHTLDVFRFNVGQIYGA